MDIIEKLTLCSLALLPILAHAEIEDPTNAFEFAYNNCEAIAVAILLGQGADAFSQHETELRDELASSLAHDIQFFYAQSENENTYGFIYAKGNASSSIAEKQLRDKTKDWAEHLQWMNTRPEALRKSFCENM